jgi:hypothetical protein
MTGNVTPTPARRRGGMRPLRAFRFSHPDLDTARSPGFAVTATGRLELASGNDALRQQLLLLISTVPGERVPPDWPCTTSAGRSSGTRPTSGSFASTPARRRMIPAAST